MALLLDMSPRFLERALYFSHWIVTRADQGKISKNIERIRDAVNDEDGRKSTIRAIWSEAASTVFEKPAAVGRGRRSITKEDVEQMRKRRRCPAMLR
jgi:hypothetical protein